MSIQSEMSCREIMQCNRKQLCLFAEGEKKACWELVQENDAYSFHICVDCLVYLAKHPDSILTEEELHFILEQRKDSIQRNKEQNPAGYVHWPCSPGSGHLEKLSFRPS